MRKLAIIGAGRMACIYAAAAHDMGVESHVFAWRKGALAADHADVFHEISTSDVEGIARVCCELGIGGVVPSSEGTILPAARIAEMLGAAGDPVDVAAHIIDKSRNRALVADVEGLLNPRWQRIENLDKLASLDFEFPFVIKPTSEGGKRGVSVVRTPADVQAALSYAKSEPNRAHAFLVEEYIEGPEYSVESLSCEGLSRVVQVTEKISSGAPHCVELGHDQPARLAPEMRARIEEIVPRALDCIGHVSGPCHTELKIAGDNIYLIECNARPGGDHIAADLTRLSTGRSYIGDAIEIALGGFDMNSLDSLEHWYAGIRFVTELTPGLKGIFDVCEHEDWCYERHQETVELMPYSHNDGYNVNYFIYFSKTGRPDFQGDADYTHLFV